jgi:hypothetical protein
MTLTNAQPQANGSRAFIAERRLLARALSLLIEHDAPAGTD